ncbi:ATP-grasp domain-containing protein [bacterium]|nr:ATP-grasp domain-containing protein [bacterium]
MRKKVLLAGGSYGDIPLIKKAKELGFYVITSGNVKEDLGHNYSDECHLVDFSDKEELLLLAERLEIDAILPSCHDLSMISCSYVAEMLSLSGYDSYITTIRLHHKDKFRDISDTLELPTPKAFSLRNKSEIPDIMKLIDFPVIIKPVDLGGGKGINIAKNQESLDLSIEKAFESSKSNKVVVEEYVKGALHSFSTIIKNKEVVFYYGDNEFSSVNPYGVSTSTSPSSSFTSVKKNLIKQIEKVSRYLELTDGLLHMQYLLDGDTINIVELTRRMPGDWYSVPVNLATNMDYTKAVLKGYLNEDIQISPTKQSGFYSRHCIMAESNGVIERLFIDDEINNNIIDRYVWIDNVKEVTDYVNQKFGLLFLQYSSLDEMNQKTKKLNNLIKVILMND